MPFIDAHSVTLSVPPPDVFEATSAYVRRSLLRAPRLLTAVLGASPSGGFEVTAAVPDERLELSGAHRFATYRLVFSISPVSSGSLLTASSYGDFPGLRGRVYRALVVSSGGHVLAVRRMLRAIERRTEHPPAA